MARPGQIDHMIQGIEALPEKYRKETTLAYLTVYLDAFNEQEEIQQQLLDGLLQWSRTSATFSFIYEIIGSILDQPRPDGFDDLQYRFILLARAKVRRSSKTLNDVLNVAEYLALGQQFIVHPVPPLAYVISFFDLELSTQEQDLYRALLLDTIGQVDKLDLQFIITGTAQYDTATSLYDQAIYA